MTDSKPTGPGRASQLGACLTVSCWLLMPLGAVTLFGLVYFIGSLAPPLTTGGLADLALGLSLAGLPVAVAVAVLRYRLYEIDRIISRTVSYAAVVGFLP